MIGQLLLFAALTVAFPGEGTRLGVEKSCYVIGATSPGVTNVTINGAAVSVYRTGAFGAVIDCQPGTNELTVISGTNRLVRTFYTAIPSTNAPSSSATSTNIYTKLDYAADVAQCAPTNKTASEITVYLDPGHGGKKDLGAKSPRGYLEKEANLLTARVVRDELVALGYNVVMTRERDEPVSLVERPRAAHEKGADCFVSIHHNAPPLNRDPSKVRYSAVYFWPKGPGGPLADSIAFRMSFAQDWITEMKDVREANFVVTRSPQIPSCLVEVDFVTNPAGEESIWNPPHRLKVGKAIAAGIDDWCRGR